MTVTRWGSWGPMTGGVKQKVVILGEGLGLQPTPRPSPHASSLDIAAVCHIPIFNHHRQCWSRLHPIPLSQPESKADRATGRLWETAMRWPNTGRGVGLFFLYLWRTEVRIRAGNVLCVLPRDGGIGGNRPAWRLRLDSSPHMTRSALGPRRPRWSATHPPPALLGGSWSLPNHTPSHTTAATHTKRKTEQVPSEQILESHGLRLIEGSLTPCPSDNWNYHLLGVHYGPDTVHALYALSPVTPTGSSSKTGTPGVEGVAIPGTRAQDKCMAWESSRQHLVSGRYFIDSPPAAYKMLLCILKMLPHSHFFDSHIINKNLLALTNLVLKRFLKIWVYLLSFSKSITLFLPSPNSNDLNYFDVSLAYKFKISKGPYQN